MFNKLFRICKLIKKKGKCVKKKKIDEDTEIEVEIPVFVPGTYLCKDEVGKNFFVPGTYLYKDEVGTRFFVPGTVYK